MQTLDIEATFDAMVGDLNLQIEELEGLEAPGWKYWAGAAAGFVVAGGIVVGTVVVLT